MDAVGKLGEYLRYGTNFEKWENNLNIVSKYAEIVICPTISILNIFYLKELEEEQVSR